MRLRLWLLSAACLVCAATALAQHSSFQMYGADLGLTNPTILALHQDQEGFLWVSTEGGLFRYDGDQFRHFGADPVANKGDTHSLHSASDGQFWVGSSSGLFRWSGERFVAVPGFEGVELESGQSIASDTLNLYVATPAGLRSLPLRDGGRPRLLSPKRSYSVFVASDRTVWFTCGSVICSLRDGREQEWGSHAGVTSGYWSSLAEDTAGRMWIRSKDQVLMREPAGSAFHAPPLPTLSSTRSTLLVPSRKGQILIPHNAGLMVCEGDDCRNYGAESGLRRAEVLTALEDREGSLWIGYSGFGLARWLGRDQWHSFAEDEGLANPGIWRIVRGDSGDLWVGTTRGLFHGSPKDGRWRFRRTDAVGDLTVYGLALEKDGSLWVGTFQSQINGLVRYYPRTGKKVLYPPSQPFPQFSTYDLSRDDSGTIRVATPRGVMQLRPGGLQLDPVPLPIDGASVYDVKASRNGLFVAGRKGLYIQQGAIHRVLTKADGLEDNNVQSVTLGPDGALWLDYFSSSGITRIELRGSKVDLRHFTVDDGLPSNVVYSQFFDARGRHWVATDIGVAVLEGDRWTRYDTSDGLVWNDCNAHAYLAEADGTVWIGTSAGLARFHPVVETRSMLPAMLITSVLRNDLRTEKNDFDSSTHGVGLRFTMLSYRRSNPRFRYRMGTGSSPWIATQAHEVRLAELPAGSYRFEVQGEAEPGMWTRPAVLRFRIRAPWYLSWPCRVGLLFLLAGIVWLWWRQRETRQRKVRIELEAAVEERTRGLAAATARAEQASRVKSEFVANISHEMRTPLTGVIGLTQLALQVAEQPEVVEHLRIAQVSAQWLLRLINDVLDFSKMEYGEVKLDPAPFALRPLVVELCSVLDQEASRKGLALKRDVEDSVPEWVLADHARLRQVLFNLIGNAIKFTSQGAVTLSVCRSVNQLKFVVADTGIGIPADKRDIVFEAFQQADNSTSRRYGGTGLGLTISKKLVELMGGHLSLESEPGKGTTFRFTIVAPEAAAPHPVAVPLPQSHSKPMRILVVEDNKVNQHLILALLRRRGHTTAVAGNGLEALSALERGRFDLVLMDVQMPEMDGLEAVRRIREAEATTGAHLPVVAMTARAMAGDRESLLAAGMDEYLEKPIQIERLDAVLSRKPSPSRESKVPCLV